MNPSPRDHSGSAPSRLTEPASDRDVALHQQRIRCEHNIKMVSHFGSFCALCLLALGLILFANLYFSTSYLTASQRDRYGTSALVVASGLLMLGWTVALNRLNAWARIVGVLLAGVSAFASALVCIATSVMLIVQFAARHEPRTVIPIDSSVLIIALIVAATIASISWNVVELLKSPEAKAI